MAIPTQCTQCGEVIGMTERGDPMTELWLGINSGPCNHPGPTRTETTRFWGLIKEITLCYPETKDISTWGEYIGPRSKLLLRIAIIFGTKKFQDGSHDGLVFRGKWVHWNSKYGLFGDGVDFLKSNKKQKAAIV